MEAVVVVAVVMIVVVVSANEAMAKVRGITLGQRGGTYKADFFAGPRQLAPLVRALDALRMGPALPQ